MKRIFISFISFIPIYLFAQPGALDPGFGTGGKVTTPIGPIQGYAYDMALQSTGDIVLAGEIWNYAMSWDFALAKYKGDGSLDPSFGTAGKVTHGGANGQTYKAVCFQNDGKILAAGFENTGQVKFIVGRYLPNGTLDNTFGTGGLTVIPFAGSTYSLCYDIALQSDGKIILGGYSDDGSTINNDFALARLDTTGAIDSSFGINGRVTTPILTYEDKGFSLIIQPDDKIILSGSSATPGIRFSAARYNADGSLDNSFGVSGIMTHFFSGSCFSFASVLQPNGKILLAGTGGNQYAISRYYNNGNIDSSFGTAGIVTTNIYPNNDWAYGITLQTNGKVVVCGLIADNPDGDFGIARYDSTGLLDPGFGTGGIVITPFDTLTDWPFKVIVQPDEKILVGGWSGVPSNGAYFAMARYNGGEIMAVEQISTSDDIKIYPNPADEKIFIESLQHEYGYSTITLQNIQGEVLLKENASTMYPHTIETSLISNGIYILIVESGENKFVRKILIHH
jgi:uncharacterized delta-60 repeat protein